MNMLYNMYINHLKNALATRNKSCTVATLHQYIACGIREASMSDPGLRLVEKGDMDKQKALDAALSQIERSFGKGSVMKLGQQDSAVEIEAIPTGSIGLDIALGIVSSRSTGPRARARRPWRSRP